MIRKAVLSYTDEEIASDAAKMVQAGSILKGCKEPNAYSDGTVLEATGKVLLALLKLEPKDREKTLRAAAILAE